MSARIEDYALLGDTLTAALVSRDGSIDWLCVPRFDAPACFAALLGNVENGCWKIAPATPARRVDRRYVDGTMVLQTRYVTDAGEACVTDFMPHGNATSSIVRIVEGVSGTVPFDMDLVMRFDYGSAVPWVEKADAHTLTAVAGPDMLVLRTDAPLVPHDHHTGSGFDVGPGDRVVFVLSHQPSNEPLRAPLDAAAELARTKAWWERFSSRCPDVGRWSAAVKRSLVTLKALTYGPTGGIVAAATTSLPECIGSERNWDYRYCWLRDATMTLYAFMNLGYFEEAGAWREWLLRSVAGNPEQMQIMYGLGGERRLPEQELPWLDGYEGSRPVRIGNEAATQTQLDIYGEVTDAMMQALRGGLPRHRRSAAIAKVMVPFLEKAWQGKDRGIWEIRGEPRHFTHSKVMAWVAFDRLARGPEGDMDDGEAGGAGADAPDVGEVDGPGSIRQRVDGHVGVPQGVPTHSVDSQRVSGRGVDEQHVDGSNADDLAWRARCRATADRIHAEVCREGYHAELGYFVQSYGSRELDASLLQLVLTGFLPADDPRIVRTVDAIESTLMRDGFVQRYASESGTDGLPPGEGTFLVCSFWLADVYVMMGRRDDALALFERLLDLCNDVGLLAEQWEPKAKRMLGNFPQAFSHIGIINTALNLHRGQTGAGGRAHGMSDADA
ncbi:glycoside hydrolase family 15 protein [Pigmentiphaga litoralis]|uniref:glycoside hydrolase family 15 protein n=1 Tax=Pigmentiphaga litoralis TaxID=516702 RepID=UPI003B4324FC